MPTLDIDGVKVEFPFIPYPCQVDYMTKLIDCLKRGVNGILESPTGTGKTLCLLCATLGWLESMKAAIEFKNLQGRQLLKDADENSLYKEELMNKFAEATGGWEGRPAAPKVIYASRTHSQLSQAMQELKRTQYRSIKAVVLGSREQMCIHPQVSKETNSSAKVFMCRAKVSARTCHFYNNVDLMKHHFTGKIMDIEDLGKLGEKHKSCPYYTTRELKQEADIIFMPYNYLLDPKSRRAHGVELAGNIIIFDEAHNLEKICEESVSFDLTSHDLAGAIEELKELCCHLIELAKEEVDSAEMIPLGEESSTVEGCDFTLKQVMEVKAILLALEKELDGLEIPTKGLTKPGHFIFELLEKIKLGFETKNYYLDVIEKILNHVTKEGSRFLTKGNGIGKIADVIKIIFSQEPENITSTSTHQVRLAKTYKVHIAKEVQDKKKTRKDLWTSAPNSDKVGRTLSYWCFSPGHSMEDLRTHGVKCIILTSGTLSPIESFSMEMGIEFPVTLQNPHIIQQHQVFVAAVTKGPDNNKLLSNYDNRSTNEYRSSLGNAVVNFARAVPNGLLIFFPSYPVMTNCIEFWQQTNIFNRITQYKAFFVEPKMKLEFQQTMNTFYEKINDPSLNGAIFAAVCRGKVSEGLDFADINGRAVVITGLPFPPMMDPKVVLKMAYLDENKNKTKTKTLLGREWYRQQASRAVNQAIGRVIRHKDDYGAVLLCDERFATSESKAQLPAWVQPHLKTITTFGLIMKDLMQFFKTAEMTLPSPVLKHQRTSSTPGCQGASFMPTEVRSGPSSQLPGAGNVESHVAGLRQRNLKLSREEEARADSIARLSIQYEMTAPKRPADKGKKRGLLDALETHATPEYEEAKIVSPKVSSSQKALEKRMQLQKKTRKTMKIKDTSVKVAMDYVHRVKSVLSTDSYKVFNKAMVEYASKANFDNLISILADLFTEDIQKMDLFRGFYQYVKAQHRAKFCELCIDITGSAPDSSSAQSTQAAVSNPGKKRRMNDVSSRESLKFSDVKATRIAPATSCGYKSEVLHVGKKSALGKWSEKRSKDTGNQNTLQAFLGSAKDSGRDTVDGVLVKHDKSEIKEMEQMRGSGTQVGQDLCREGSRLVERVAEEVKGSEPSTGEALLSQGDKTEKETLVRETHGSSSGSKTCDQISNGTHVPGKQGDEYVRNQVQGADADVEINVVRKRDVVKVGPSSTTCEQKVPCDVSNMEGNKAEEKLDRNKNLVSKTTLHVGADSGMAAGQSKNLPTTDKAVSNSADSTTSSVPLEDQCCACQKTALAPLRAQTCGHMCCFPCWKKILLDPTGAPKLCPQCGSVVRRKDLVKVSKR